MKIIIIIFLTLINTEIFGRTFGETEITAEDGIEVFQNEKYYVLKKNVNILSDDFTLSGSLVKINFNKDLYDIVDIDASGDVKLNSHEHNLEAVGYNIKIIVENEKIIINGQNSKLLTKEIEMFSDGSIIVNNLNGNFYLSGPGSTLISEGTIIKGENIEGKLSVENDNEIIFLDVYDKNLAFINTTDNKMYANSIRYNKDKSLIELKENVKIISEGEAITGDYGTLDTKTNSYKIKSNNTDRVKVIIKNTDE